MVGRCSLNRSFKRLSFCIVNYSGYIDDHGDEVFNVQVRLLFMGRVSPVEKKVYVVSL